LWITGQDLALSRKRFVFNQEADRIYALAKRAAPYGIKVALYNHNGWFGMMDNELAGAQAVEKNAE